MTYKLLDLDYGRFCLFGRTSFSLRLKMTMAFFNFIYQLLQ